MSSKIKYIYVLFILLILGCENSINLNWELTDERSLIVITYGLQGEKTGCYHRRRVIFFESHEDLLSGSNQIIQLDTDGIWSADAAAVSISDIVQDTVYIRVQTAYSHDCYTNNISFYYDDPIIISPFNGETLFHAYSDLLIRE